MGFGKNSSKPSVSARSRVTSRLSLVSITARTCFPLDSARQLQRGHAIGLRHHVRQQPPNIHWLATACTKNRLFGLVIDDQDIGNTCAPLRQSYPIVEKGWIYEG